MLANSFLIINMSSSTNYFTNTRRGEIPELQEELNSTKPDKKREAVKKVIAAMTIGKDVSALFSHVVKCMETQNIELKKLVYLYIINYARTLPDHALMAVNSFRKDARHPSNPLVRALAVRTMGYIRVPTIIEYLCEPLRDALKDKDPYVRKTAVLCVAKLYDISPDLVEDDDFMNSLIELLSDGNAQVVANTVATIAEITELRGRPIAQLNNTLVTTILAALNECTEWGQVFILDFIASYTPNDSKEAEAIIERVVPRLAHANPAVVLSAAKVILKLMDMISATDTIRNLTKKLAPSLITLISSEPEIQYVALRCINLIVQKRPQLLEKEVRVFFCKYNDPSYVKLEKLEIMIRLVDSRNVEQVLHELKEYATEVDVEFVRKAVRCIGRVAIKLDKAVDKCVSTLMELITLGKDYLVQEIIIVIRDIFRKYPNRYEMVIKDIFASIQQLDDNEAKASLIWIIGENADKIADSPAQLKNFIDNFTDEPASVQFQILTATVKLFLKRPDEAEELITTLLQTATECSNPDLRDRAYIYWRLLSIDPEGTKDIVLCDKPPISEQYYTYEATMIEKLIEQLGTLASVYHKPADTAMSKLREKVMQKEKEEILDLDLDAAATSPPQPIPVLIDALETPGVTPISPTPAPTQVMPSGQIDLLNLVEDYFPSGSPVVSPVSPISNTAKIPLQTVLSYDIPGVNQNRGLQIEMAFQRENGRVMLETKLKNFTAAPLTDFAMQFNNNYFGLALAEPLMISALLPNQELFLHLIVNPNENLNEILPSVPYIVQMAIKCTLDIFYFQTPCMYSVLLKENPALDREAFKDTWKIISDANEFSHEMASLHPSFSSIEAIKTRLTSNNIFFVGSRRDEMGDDVLYFSSKNVRDQLVLAELTVKSSFSVHISCKTDVPALAPLFIQSVNFLLSTSS